MQSCFVSIPFGIKTLPDGRALDFDFLYNQVIKPAVTDLGLECKRLDEYPPGAIWQKTMFAAVISSELLISDIGSGNANVFYELGVRHALGRGRTILISAGGRIPGDIDYYQALFYDPDETGRLTGPAAESFRDQLQSNIRQSQRSLVSDSPIYEFYPDLEVSYPPELEGSARRRRPRTKGQRAFAQSVVETPDQAKGDLEGIEAEVRGSQ